MPTKDETILSKTITILRFPLIVAVVLIHTGFKDVMIGGNSFMDGGQMPFYSLLHHVVADELAAIAVPLFFLMSGFLFFHRSDFTAKTYGQKLRKRVRTLLVPYLLWNAAAFCLTFLAQQLMASMLSGRSKMISDYGWMDWACLFWSHDNWGMPVCYQFWFIRDLMVVIVLSPAIYFLVKYLRVFGVAALGVLWITELRLDITGFNIAAFFFFACGAWFGINGRNFATDLQPLRHAATIIYLAIVAIDSWLWHTGQLVNCHLLNTGILFGLTATVAWTAHGIAAGRLHTSALLAGSAFFIYAYHGMPTALALKVWMKLTAPASEWTLLAGSIVIPIIIVAGGICLHTLLRKHLPAFTALITGGR